MKRSTLARITALAIVTATLTPISAVHAQDPLCKQLAETMLRQMSHPFHSYMTEVAGYNGNKPEQSEMVSTGTAMYIMVNGRWRRSPQNPQQLASTMREAAGDMKDHSCRKLGSEVVNGVPAMHYHVDVKDPDSPSSTDLWVAANGLPLKSVTDMNVGGGAEGHTRMSTRYEYNNVTAPAGVR